MVIYIIIRESKCWEGSISLPKKYGLAKEASFDLKTSIYAMNLKLHISQLLFLYLSKTSNQIVACVGLESVTHYYKYTFEI